MAMIKCPNCNGEISDKSVNCIHCGLDIQSNYIVCSECGSVINKTAAFCGNCGCPIEKFEASKVIAAKKSKKKLIIIIALMILLIVGAICGYKIYTNIQEERDFNERLQEETNRKNEFKKNYSKAVHYMLTGAAKAEESGNLIKSVWYNCIFEKNDKTTNKYTRKNNGKGAFYDDFNVALKLLFKDSTFASKIEEIENNQEEVRKLMLSLKNYPNGYEGEYNDIKEYYDNYLELTNIVVSPSGSLQTFSNNFNDYDTKTVNSYKKCKDYFEPYYEV